jgi:hypothetical protein
MKMDIEGAEARVLKQNTEWASKVRCIKVECHAPYTTDEAKEDLNRLGFDVVKDNLHWASIIGVKPRTQDDVVASSMPV